MGLAGPLANLGLCAVGFAVLRIGLALGVWDAAAASDFSQLVAPVAEGAGALDAVARLASILTFLNLVLFVFNLIPLPPLDGSQVLAGLFSPARRARDVLRESTAGSLVGLLAAWSIFPYLFRPIWRLAEAVLFG
jgi:Zn-dependent protease